MSAEHQPSSARGEWIKFGIFVAVLVITMVVIAAVNPLIANYIVPTVMGKNQPAITEPIAQPAPAEEAPTAPEATTDSTNGESPAPAGEVEEMGEVEQVEAPEAPSETETNPEETAAEPTPTRTISYTVKAGDTLYDIARAHGSTIEAIVAATEGLNRPNDVIKPGMVLTIPVR